MLDLNIICPLLNLTALLGYLDCFPEVLNFLVQLALGVIVCKNLPASKEGVKLFQHRPSQEFFAHLEDCVGIKDSGKSFVDLILDLGRSVNALLVVVLCLGDGVQLEKGSCVKTELNCSKTCLIPPSSHHRSASEPLSLASEVFGTSLRMCSSFLRCSATKCYLSIALNMTNSPSDRRAFSLQWLLCFPRVPSSH